MPEHNNNVAIIAAAVIILTAPPMADCISFVVAFITAIAILLACLLLRDL